MDIENTKAGIGDRVSGIGEIQKQARGSWVGDAGKASQVPSPESQVLMGVRRRRDSRSRLCGLALKGRSTYT